jgi:hypothetical protein
VSSLSNKPTSIKTNRKALDRLRQAHSAQNLVLYLGAGVSVANNIPTWEKLVSAMYFAAIPTDAMGVWRPYPNYLFAIAEWHLSRSSEPLEITARKISKHHSSPESFLKSLRKTLYAAFANPYIDDSFQDGMEYYQPLQPQALREANKTLDSVAKLCENNNGVRSVITYNYDELLEVALRESRDFQSIYGSQPLESDRLPIYHVHGYVPIDPAVEGSTAEEIVFTEEQYHLVAQDGYSRSNLVQLQAMSTSVGLMVGLSGSDRNMRRLLDAVKKAPLNCENYILMQKPHWHPPSDEQLDTIHRTAQQYVDDFEKSGVKSEGRSGEDHWNQILRILEQVEELHVSQQKSVLQDLGITPIYYKKHEDIPDLIGYILN